MNPWTEADKNYAAERFASGETAKSIGERLGRSKNSVLGQIYRMGLSTPKPEPETRPKPIKADGCQWIQGDPKDRNFCGKLTNGGSWCEEHHARVFRKIEVGQAA